MVKVAVVQMVSSDHWRDNLQQVKELVAEAASKGAGLVLLPENFILFSGAKLRGFAEEYFVELLLQLKALAAQHDIWLVCGSLPLIDDPVGNPVADCRVRSSCLVISPEGLCSARYDKIHLFDVEVEDSHASYRESAQIEPGTEIVIADTALAKVGLTICYDLRFPELYQRLRALGAELIVVPSAFTYVTGKAHWEVLLRARAIETQCYILAANQGGQHSVSRQTWGHSMIIAPDGEILAEQQQSGPGVVVAEFDRLYLEQVRQKMPVALHRAEVGF